MTIHEFESGILKDLKKEIEDNSYVEDLSLDGKLVIEKEKILDILEKRLKSKLTHDNHQSHKDILADFYYHNKNILTEQMKDALLDAIDCMVFIWNLR